MSTMRDEQDCFARWAAGNAAIIRRELDTGRDAPAHWYAALAAVERQCREAEDRRRAAEPAQPRLFAAGGWR